MLIEYNAHGWSLGDYKKYETDTDPTVTHSGKESVFIKSATPAPKRFGFIWRTDSVDQHVGKRLRMSAWVKTALDPNAAAQLWIRVDGDWKKRPGCFDNMFDSRIKGATDWTQYNLVVNVPESSSKVVFGILINGTGKAWLDDVSLETVDDDVALTGELRNIEVSVRDLDCSLVD